MSACPPVVEELVYERHGPSAEAWVRCSIQRGPEGARVVLDYHNQTVRLEPTRFVLEGVTRALRAVEPAELLTGSVTLGAAGVRALERLSAHGRAA